MHAFLKIKTKFRLLNRILRNRKCEEEPNLLGNTGYTHVRWLVYVVMLCEKGVVRS
jgi:hypothetical protein